VGNLTQNQTNLSNENMNNKNLDQKLKEIEQDKRWILSNYRKERHLELLKRSEELESLSINESEEISYYSALLHEQLNWETQEDFLQLQEKLLKNKITIGQFCRVFSKRDLVNSEAAAMLESNFILLSPHKKSLDFSKLTDEILNACYSYDPDPESIEIKEIEEKEFRNLVQTIYLQIQNLLKE
jgi:hypothetical protein